MISFEEARRIALDDELSAHPRGQRVVIGCGNLLRGDDAVGPIAIRHLWELGLPDDVTLVDGGTGGMDVAFKMRGAAEVILIDAAQTGAEPGTIYKVPGDQLEELPPVDGLHSHQFRWDHALAFGRWLLGDDYPTQITVWLVEAASTAHGAQLSEPVTAAMETVIRSVVGHLADQSDTGETAVAPDNIDTDRLEITQEGSVRMTADTAKRYFPSDACVVNIRENTLVLTPLVGPQHGGLLLKQRNPAGDRSMLILDVLVDNDVDVATVAGTHNIHWDADVCAAEIRFDQADAASQTDRVAARQVVPRRPDE